MDKFTDAELEVIKRFLDVAGQFIDSDEGVVGYDDNGVTVKEWETEYSYGDTYLTSSGSFIPWIALTDPEEHQRQEEKRRQEEAIEAEKRRRELLARNEAKEREALAALKAKYGE
jgi:hypothetical protein